MTTRAALVDEIRDRLVLADRPRLTISIILAFAGGAAFLTSFATLAIGLDSMAARYALASIAGYLAFVGLIRGWIAIRRGWAPDVGDLANPFDWVDSADGASAAGRAAGRAVDAGRTFAGGQSGGAGGGTEWVPEPVERVTPLRDAVSTARQAGSDAAREAGRGAGPDAGKGWELPIDLDDGLIFIVIAAIAGLCGVICILYVVYIAPMLLAEVALDAALVSAAYRKLRREDVGHWSGAVFRRTLVPATLLVVFMFVTGFAAQLYAPDAISIGGVVRVLVS